MGNRLDSTFNARLGSARLSARQGGKMMEGRGSSLERRHRSMLGRMLGVAIGLVGLLALPPAAFAIDEFPVGSKPGGITTGPDGALWFTEEGPPPPAQPVNFIGRLTPSGQYTHFQLPNLGS